MPKAGVSAGKGPESLKPWKVLNSRQIFAADPWIKLSVDQVLLPDGKIVDDYYQIGLQEHVVIFAETLAEQVVALRLYKHGAGKVCVVLPAGAVENSEPPLVSAQRELLEETGFTSDHWGHLGSFVVNGNYGCGRSHLFVARNATQTAKPDSGDLEEMEVILMRPGEILDAVKHGEIAGVGTVATIALAMNSQYPDNAAAEVET